MFLTKFPINLTRRETRPMMASPYRMHAAIAGSFVREVACPNCEGRVLWRVDRNDRGSATLYIVSPDEPSLIGLDEQIGWPDLEPQWVTRDYDTILDRITEGQQYRFRLVANPVVSRKGVTDGHGRSKRMPHVTPIQQQAWLIGSVAYEGKDIPLPSHLKFEKVSRAERNGFAVMRDQGNGEPQLLVSNSREHRFRQGKGANWIKLSTVQYDGLLEVTDATLMRRALVNGIGRGKGFGCGLITLAPVV